MAGLSDFTLNLSDTNKKSIRDFALSTLPDKGGQLVILWCHDQLSGGAKESNMQRLWWVFHKLPTQNVSVSILEQCMTRSGVKRRTGNSGVKIQLDPTTCENIKTFSHKRCSGNVESVFEFLSTHCKGGPKDSNRQALYFAFVNAGHKWNVDEIALDDLRDAASRAGIKFN